MRDDKKLPVDRFYVVGGLRRDKARPVGSAVVVEVDVASETAEVVLEYVPPSVVVPSGGRSRVHFGAGSREGDCLYLCTQTEVVVYRLPAFEMIRRLSLPCFNDLHHVRPRVQGTLLIANTGLDMVLEVDQENRVVREWSAVGGDPWERFDRDVDYRLVESTKPHQVHPNHVFEADGEIWVTRFEQRDVRCLTAKGRVSLGPERPHDGVVTADGVWFTQVDGQLVHLRPGSGPTIVDLNAFARSRMALGWCRGLLPLSSERVLVGFSRIRPTRFRENLRWLKHRAGWRATPGVLPTRVVCADLSRRELSWELDLEPVGVDLIFSIHTVVGAG